MAVPCVKSNELYLPMYCILRTSLIAVLMLIILLRLLRKPCSEIEMRNTTNSHFILFNYRDIKQLVVK